MIRQLEPKLGVQAAARGLRAWWRTGRLTGVRLLVPLRCVACGMDIESSVDDLPLCPTCLRQFTVDHAADICTRCGAIQSLAGTCSACRGRRFAFQTVVPLGMYRDQLRAAILQMKRPTGDPLSSAMGRLYCQHRAALLRSLHADVVVPIPMHWRHHFRRGTNNPELLAAEIAHVLGVPSEDRMLVRWRKTRPQNDLPPSQRWENMRGAFRIRRGFSIQGAKVILVDDVLTTGATCHAAATTLRRAGAAEVAVAVVARAAKSVRPESFTTRSQPEASARTPQGIAPKASSQENTPLD